MGYISSERSERGGARRSRGGKQKRSERSDVELTVCDNPAFGDETNLLAIRIFKDQQSAFDLAFDLALDLALELPLPLESGKGRG